MAFTIIGPGIRDEIKLSNLFEKKVVEKVDGIVPVRHIDKDLEFDSGVQHGRERIRQAYGNNSAGELYKELTAEQLMSSPVDTLSVNTSIEDAWRFFRQHRFRHVPIVDDEGKLQGIVSDRDLLADVEYRLSNKQENVANAFVNEIMKTRVLTATPETVISHIAGVFFQQRIGAMPIVSGDSVVGMITRSDILGAIVYSTPVETWA